MTKFFLDRIDFEEINRRCCKLPKSFWSNLVYECRTHEIALPMIQDRAVGRLCFNRIHYR